jgi:hypothetical protein
MTGILAVWNDCAPGAEIDYEQWYTREHMPERLSVPGFRTGWRYDGVIGDPHFFTYYTTDTPDVLASPAYLARLENPTPWTRRIMQSTFRRAIRTVCELSTCIGAMAGSHAVTLRWQGTVDSAPAAAAASELASIEGVTKVQIWTATGALTKQTEEARIRGGDALIGGSLVVDCVRRSDAERVSGLLVSGQYGQRLAPKSDAMLGIYAFLCMLEQKKHESP